MKKKVLSLFLAVTMCLGFTNIGAASSSTVNLTKQIKVINIKGRKMKKKEAKKITSASVKLLNETMKNDEEGANVLISPTSVMYAFGILENGAKGKTRKQIEKNIFGGIKTSDTNKILKKQMDDMEDDKFVTWNIANSVWVSNRKDVKVKKNYLKKTISYFDADVFKTPFDDDCVKDMNKWVKKNTNNMIPKIVDELDEDTVSALINAICFEGTWADKFSDYSIEEDQDFTNYDGSISKVTQMSGEVGGYFKLNGAYGFEKYYTGGKYAFVGIKMPEGTSTSDYIEKLVQNPAKFNKALNNIKTDKKVNITMPEFSLDYNAELNAPIKKLGVTRAFSKRKANLYNMFKKDGDTNYFVNKVIHKTHIEVDKNGTKAAAVTAIMIEKNMAVLDERETLQITLDNPFVYAIVDTEKGIPVFMGCVNKLD